MAAVMSGSRVINSRERYRAALERLGALAEFGEGSESSVAAAAEIKNLRSQKTTDLAQEKEEEKPILPLPLPLPLLLLPSFPPNFPTTKRIPGTRFIVDGFRVAGPFAVAYFLSHFHSDHYTGITPLWNKGLIFCSEITASLLRLSLKVPDSLVVSLAMNENFCIDGVDVILVDANHCPGAVQFLFRVPVEEENDDDDDDDDDALALLEKKKGGRGCSSKEFRRYVHTGDMRFSHSMKQVSSPLCEFVGADAVFLDTTYCNPKFVFPSQSESVQYVAETIHRLMMQGGGDGERMDSEVKPINGNEADNKNTRASETTLHALEHGSREVDRDLSNDGEEEQERPEEVDCFDESAPASEDSYRREISQMLSVDRSTTLFLISTYVIGKEKILTAVAKQCNCLLYVNERKLSILKCLNLENIGVFTTDPSATNVHVVGWNFLGETWPYFRPNFGNMENLLTDSGFSRVVGFVPTGWTYEIKKKVFSVKRKGACEIHLVPYSEHSNYDELREFIAFLRPKEIIPTVGLEGKGMEGKAVAAMRMHFRNLVDETASKKKFLRGFSQKAVIKESSNVKREQADLEACSLGGGNSASKAVGAGGTKADSANKVQNSPENGAETSYQLPPKAAFGRGARKRHRDNEELNAGTGGERTQNDLVIQRGSGTIPEQKTQESGKCTVSAMAIDSRIGVGLRTPETSLMDLGVPSGRVSHIEKKDQLKLILPICLSDAQIDMLLEQAKGDVNVAVSLYYEQESVQDDAGVTGQATETGVSLGISLSFREDNRSVAVAGSQSIESFERNQVWLTPLASPKDSQNGKKVGTKKLSKVSNPNTKSHSRSSTRTGTSKSKAQVALPPQRRKQGLQPTILNFFEKVAPKFSPSMNDLGVDNQVSSTQIEEIQSVSLTGGKDSPQAVRRPNISTEVDPSRRDGDVVDVVTSPVEEIVGKSLPSTERDLDECNDKVDQLLSVLAGNITKEAAQVLLQNANGDVGMALDLYYRENLGSERGQSPPCVPIISECTRDIDATSEDDQQRVALSSEVEGDEDRLATVDMGADLASACGNSAEIMCSMSEVQSHVHPTSDPASEQKPGGSIALPVGKYDPIAHACWRMGEPAPYLHLARTFDLVEQESGRLRTVDMLTNMFRSLLALSPEDVLPAIYLATNGIAPGFENTDLNIGGSTVAAAISDATGTQRAKLREMYNIMGDLGDVAQSCRQNQSMLRPPPALHIRQVFSTLHQISKETGSGSGARKKALVLRLIRACREKETKYIVRTLVQNMRIGATMGTMLPALAQAVVFHRSLPSDLPVDKAQASLKAKLQEAASAVVEAYNFLPNLDLLVPMLISEGMESLASSVRVSLGTPIKPMLAKITNGISEVVKRFQGKAFSCEYKYDGQRAQIHLQPDGSVRIFSRNGDDSTSRFPDVADIVRAAMQPQTSSFIIDAEVVAVNRENGNKLMAFQHLSTRERGTRDGGIINVQNIKVSVCVFLFDLMFANGELLVKHPLRKRRKCMQELFPNVRSGYFCYASEITVEAADAQPDSETTLQRLTSFFEEALASSCEGLMGKSLDDDATYMASKRSDSWLKVKRDYVEGLHDTLDLVPIGAWHGNGRKAGWYSPYLLACYDPDREEYQSVCRVMSGFSDAFYKETKLLFSEGHLLPRKPVYYQTGEECDVWFSTKVVWEIAGADLTISPVHQAGIGLVHPTRGISMRFPRFISVRTDKNPETASSPSDIADLFNRQTRKLDIENASTLGKQEGDSD